MIDLAASITLVSSDSISMRSAITLFMYRLHVKHSCDMECGSPAIMATLPCQNNFCSLQGLVPMRLQLIWLVVLSSIYCQLFWHIQRSLKKRVMSCCKNWDMKIDKKQWSEQNNHKVKYLPENLDLKNLSWRGWIHNIHICKASVYHDSHSIDIISTILHILKANISTCLDISTLICAIRLTHINFSTFHAFWNIYYHRTQIYEIFIFYCSCYTDDPINQNFGFCDVVLTQHNTTQM